MAKNHCFGLLLLPGLAFFGQNMAPEKMPAKTEAAQANPIFAQAFGLAWHKIGKFRKPFPNKRVDFIHFMFA